MKMVFIVWAPYSRRSKTLANEFGAKIYFIHWKFRRKIYWIFKYLIQFIKTILILKKEKPEIIFAQNPPLFCPLTALIYSKIFGSRLVVDNHTLAFYGYWKRVSFLNNWILKNADLVTLANEDLKKITNSYDVNSFVIESKIPNFGKMKKIKLKGKFNITVINTFSDDEPVDEIFKAIEKVPEINFNITGDLKYAKSHYIKNKPKNVRYTGFISGKKYIDLLKKSNAIMILTTENHTMLSGAFEGVGVEKPLLISNWSVLKNYFNAGVIYTNNKSENIVKAIKKIRREEKKLIERIKILRKKRTVEWNLKFKKLKNMLKNLYNN